MRKFSPVPTLLPTRTLGVGCRVLHNGAGRRGLRLWNDNEHVTHFLFSFWFERCLFPFAGSLLCRRVSLSLPYILLYSICIIYLLSFSLSVIFSYSQLGRLLLVVGGGLCMGACMRSVRLFDRNAPCDAATTTTTTPTLMPPSPLVYIQHVALGDIDIYYIVYTNGYIPC